MPKLRQLVAGFLLDTSNFDSRAVHVEFVVDTFFSNIWFFFVSNHYASVPLAYSFMLRSLLNRSQNTHKQTSRTSSVFILPAHSGDDLHIPI